MAIKNTQVEELKALLTKLEASQTLYQILYVQLDSAFKQLDEVKKNSLSGYEKKLKEGKMQIEGLLRELQTDRQNRSCKWLSQMDDDRRFLSLEEIFDPNSIEKQLQLGRDLQ